MVLKRLFDILAASIGLLVFSPLLAAVMLAIWLQDLSLIHISEPTRPY